MQSLRKAGALEDQFGIEEPVALAGIMARTRAAGFSMASEPRTGALLRTLAASKPGGTLLELGTGTGLGTAWLLQGMDDDARLRTVDIDPEVSRIASDALGDDPRVTFIVGDAIDYIRQAKAESFDLIFADAIAGKFEGLSATLDLVAPGGFYVIDDLLRQDNWPEGHEALISPLLDAIETRTDFTSLRLSWSTGILIATKTLTRHD